MLSRSLLFAAAVLFTAVEHAPAVWRGPPQMLVALDHETQDWVKALKNKGLRRIEWVILGLKTRQSWGLRGVFHFGGVGIWQWLEHRNAAGGFGIRIHFLVFDQNRQCAGFLVIRKHG